MMFRVASAPDSERGEIRLQGEGTRTTFFLEGLAHKIDFSPWNPVGLLRRRMNLLSWSYC